MKFPAKFVCRFFATMHYTVHKNPSVYEVSSLSLACRLLVA